MSEITIARRYAQALNEQAAQDGTLEQIDADIDLISHALAGSRELVNFFSSPIISRKKKAAVIGTLFKESLQPVTMRFLELLVSKRRENFFLPIVSSYRKLRDDQLGIKPVSVRTAFDLSEGDLSALTASLEKLTDSKVRLSMKVDPSILGGLVIRIGDMVYDGSVTNQLATLRERLETGSHA
ncbi:MAG: ATP synthase F1 subunit delta [Bacteroidetes bacterium]|nr:ATP synthase F1 subunit delta [Bacteroidota bacterium]MDA1332899.1 ATP synthase F1 subunit delta [Bacteroidota bacterium]